MDYGFTANMEKQLDDVAEGKLDKLKIIKPFYDYVQEQIKIVPINMQNSNTGNNYKPPAKIGIYDEQDIILCDGPYGKYVTHNKSKFNLKSLFEGPKKTTNDLSDSMDADLEAELKAEGDLKSKNTKSTIKVNNNSDDDYDNDDMNNTEISVLDEESIDLSSLPHETILTKVIEKIESLKQAVIKEWKIGRKKYILKNGQFGHYVEEWNSSTNKKTGNFSVKYLINKIGKNNKIDSTNKEGIDKIVELISSEDIGETIEYFSKNKKTTATKYVKK